jgi:hypothetical protein
MSSTISFKAKGLPTKRGQKDTATSVPGTFWAKKYLVPKRIIRHVVLNKKEFFAFML